VYHYYRLLTKKRTKEVQEVFIKEDILEKHSFNKLFGGGEIKNNG
jgi:hypothetical protein